MRIAAVAPLLMMTLFGITSSAQQPNAIEIDGSKSPELIPEYLVWSYAFHFLHNQRSNPRVVDSLKHRYLPMPAADYELLWRTVAKVNEREADHYKVQKETFDLAMNAPEGEKRRRRDEFRDSVVQMRQDILDLADDLMKQLSPQGRTALEAWKESRRATITATVPRNEMDYFKRPR
jgi:hypothetical protein